MQESFKTNMQHCRDPNITLIIVFEVFGLLLRKKKSRGVSITGPFLSEYTAANMGQQLVVIQSVSMQE